MLSASRGIADYIEKFRAALPSMTLSSMKYSFSVFLVPRVANRASAADAAVQFVRIDEASPEELSRLDKLNVLIRGKQIPIANLNLSKAADVVKTLKPLLPYKISLSTHTRAWHHFQVRPAAGASAPEKTDGRYCVYDPVHHDYVYTQAWIEKVAKDLADAVTFQQVVGSSPQPK